MKPTQEQIEAAAAAIANMRGGRRGIPPISNVLEMLVGVSPKLHDEVMEDARAALEAISMRPTVQPPGQLRPGQQTCKRCGAVDHMNFHVPDDIWRAVTSPEWSNETADSVLCLACFDDLAFERSINYAHVITHVLFAGRQASIGFTIFDEDALDQEEFKE